MLEIKCLRGNGRDAFRTDDGYVLRKVDGEWTDGDLTFKDVDGRPVDENGEALDGEFDARPEEIRVPVTLIRLMRHQGNDGYVTYVGDMSDGSYYGALVPDGGRNVEAYMAGETVLPMEMLALHSVPFEFRAAVLRAVRA